MDWKKQFYLISFVWIITFLVYYIANLTNYEGLFDWINFWAYFGTTVIVSVLVSTYSKNLFRTIWLTTLVTYGIGVVYLFIITVLDSQPIAELILWIIPLIIIVGGYLLPGAIFTAYMAHLLMHYQSRKKNSKVRKK